jgi:hypothetical protein
MDALDHPWEKLAAPPLAALGLGMVRYHIYRYNIELNTGIESIITPAGRLGGPEHKDGWTAL